MNQFKEHRLRAQFITLMYLDDPRTFDPSAYHDAQQLTGPYRIALQMPIAEFFGRTPMEIAMELVQHTVSAGWKEGRKRGILPGDLFCIGMQPWLVVDKEQARYYPINTVQWDGKWPSGAIVQLPGEVVAAMGGKPQGQCDEQDTGSFA